MTVDFVVDDRVEPDDAAALAAALAAARQPVRLAGGATHQRRVPVPDAPVLLLSARRLVRITRLDAGDHTCSVEPGVARSELDSALAEHRLELPVGGGGSLGGLFARGEDNPLAPGAPSLRHLLLGLEGALADGTRFRCGARVVKSVAGFDLHKAFVGSRGRLFAATLLHLKLRAVPRARLHFAQRLALDDAAALFRHLRLLPAPPAALVLRLEADGSAMVAGTVEGAPEHVEAQQREHGLDATAAPPAVEPAPLQPGEEIVDAILRPSRAPELLRGLPAGARAVVTGTGQARVAGDAAVADGALQWLRAAGGRGEVLVASGNRRGFGTGTDAAVAALEARLRAELDPQRRLR